MKSALTSGLGLVLLAAGPVWAAPGIGTIEVTPNKVVATIELPGLITADLTLTFEQAIGLTEESIGLSAQLVNPTDAGLIARLPSLTSIPAAFPVLISIEPPATGPLAFSGIVAIDLHTHALTYVPGTPLRLFVAQSGKSFQDITASVGLGSYRTGANKGGFSEFLIVADLRSVDAVIADKFKRLAALVDTYGSSMPSDVLSSLHLQLSAAQKLYATGDTLTTAQQIQRFANTVEQNSGAIPDVWRSARDVVNVAGLLRSAASTLKFSLIVKASGAS